MRGLTCRFQLQNGRFQLTEENIKVKDSLWFYCTFDKFRVYLSDYGADFLSLVQKPLSTLQLNRTLILGKLQKGLEQYVPNIKVKGMDIGYDVSNRTEYHLLLNYEVILDDKTKINDVIFI
jgi:hypothetical protein